MAVKWKWNNNSVVSKTKEQTKIFVPYERIKKTGNDSFWDIFNAPVYRIPSMVITDDGTMTLIDDDKVINRQGLKEEEDRIREEKENIKKNRPKTIEKEDVPDLITNSPTVESDEYYVAESSPKHDPFDDPDAY